MATDTVTIEQFIAGNKISITSKRVDRNPHMDAGSTTMDNWKCTLIYGAMSGRKARMTVHFSKGFGHHGQEPTVAEVLDCLASDASGVDGCRDFADWCNEYGYEVDSRKAEKTWQACRHQTTRLENFLGQDLYGELLYKTERA